MCTKSKIITKTLLQSYIIYSNAYEEAGQSSKMKIPAKTVNDLQEKTQSHLQLRDYNRTFGILKQKLLRKENDTDI